MQLIRPLLQLAAVCPLLFCLASCSPQGESSERAPNLNETTGSTDPGLKTDSSLKTGPSLQAESPESPLDKKIDTAPSTPPEPEPETSGTPIESTPIESTPAESTLAEGPKPTNIARPRLEDVKIEIVKTGTGEAVGNAASTGEDITLILSYKATLPDGSPVAAATREAPFRFRRNDESIIEGWRRGIEGAKVGEIRRLQIPARYAYGQRGLREQNTQSYRVPPGSSIFIEMEILEIDS